MIEVKVKDAALREAAMQDMDAFLGVFINATKEAIGGELNAENMQQLSVAQITLLAYDILHEEVMDGGFVQLIYNGYGGFIFDNPFAKVLREWGLRDLAKMLFAVRKLYKEYGEKIQRECSDDEFMAMFEQFPEFDDYDDEFVENEEDWTEAVARYVDEHIEEFVVLRNKKNKRVESAAQGRLAVVSYARGVRLQDDYEQGTGTH